MVFNNCILYNKGKTQVQIKLLAVKDANNIWYITFEFIISIYLRHHYCQVLEFKSEFKNQLLTIQLSKYQLLKYQLPKFQLPKYQLPKYQLPLFQLPKYQMPLFQLPKFQLRLFQLPKFQYKVMGLWIEN